MGMVNKTIEVQYSWQRVPNPPPPLFYEDLSIFPTLHFSNFVSILQAKKHSTLRDQETDTPI